MSTASYSPSVVIGGCLAITRISLTVLHATVSTNPHTGHIKLRERNDGVVVHESVKKASTLSIRNMRIYPTVVWEVYRHFGRTFVLDLRVRQLARSSHQSFLIGTCLGIFFDLEDGGKLLNLF